MRGISAAGLHHGWRGEWRPPGTLPRTRLHRAGVQSLRASARVRTQRAVSFVRHHLGTRPRWDGLLSLALPGSRSGLSGSLTLFSLPIAEGPPCQDPRGQDRQLQCLPAQQAQRTPHGGTGADGRRPQGLDWAEGRGTGFFSLSRGTTTPKAPM